MANYTGVFPPLTITQSPNIYSWSLHTLRLESLKLVFQPLKFPVNNSSGNSVRTSTLWMTHIIFPRIVYRQIIALIIHYITIPVGQKFTYTKLTVPLNSLENSRKLSLKASDRLIDIIWVNWRCLCGCISKPTFKLCASLLDIMGKIKRNEPRFF